jgi:hypothetical protein
MKYSIETTTSSQNSTNAVLTAAHLSDEILTEAFHILFGRSWKKIKQEKCDQLSMAIPNLVVHLKIGWLLLSICYRIVVNGMRVYLLFLRINR